MPHAHILGIGGVAMSATAVLLREKGYTISGTDEAVYPPVSDYLEAQGLAYTAGYAAENIPEKTDLVVIGKNAKLTKDNKEVAEAFARGLTIKSYPEVLADIAQELQQIVVCGSFGKSTCTALATFILQHAGKHPSYMIGAWPVGMAQTSHLDKGTMFVMEGDEYPTSNFDNAAKFAHYAPNHILLTSATHDHVNVYPTVESYRKPFAELLANKQRVGVVVYCADNSDAEAIAAESGVPAISYGLQAGDYRAKHIEYSATSRFTLTKNGKPLGALATRLLGAHNIQNCVGVAALLLEAGYVTFSELQTGMAAFMGVRRRLDALAPESAIPVYEGFGSSYEKARAAIDALKLHYPDKPLHIVFEPHTFSWRNREALHWYDDVFNGASHVYVYPVNQLGAATQTQSSQEDIVMRVANGAENTPVTALTDADQGLTLLQENLSGNEAILLLTSGELGGLIKTIPAMVTGRFPRG